LKVRFAGTTTDATIWKCACEQTSFYFPLLFSGQMTHRIVMPIRPSQRWFYPIDWRELSQGHRQVKPCGFAVPDRRAIADV
jgi:hypothetical protein